MKSGNPACNKCIHVNQQYDLVIPWQRLLQSKSTYSQGAERTKLHVYLPYRGAISFYVYIVPLGLIRIFLYVGRV